MFIKDKTFSRIIDIQKNAFGLKVYICVLQYYWKWQLSVIIYTMLLHFAQNDWKP